MPIDFELMEFADRLTSITEPGEADGDLLVQANELLAGPVEKAPSLLTERFGKLRRKEAEEQAVLYRRAEAELAESYLPAWKTYAIGTGGDIVSLAARAVGQGEYADRMNRFTAAVDQVQRERDKDGFIPAIIKSGARGAGRSLTTMIPAATIAGPYGAIAIASAQETNRSITDGRDAGLKGRDLAAYAVTQGVIEAVPASVMQRLGLGGVESLVSRKAVSDGVQAGLKRLGKDIAHELIEENITEISHDIAAYLSEVEEEISLESLMNTVAETTVQTVIMGAMAEARNAARPMDSRQIADEIVTATEEGRVLSRRQWGRLGLPKREGKSEGTRGAFQGELASMLKPGAVDPTFRLTPPDEVAVPEPQVAPEAVEAPVEAPAAAVEPQDVPLVSQVAPEAETDLLPQPLAPLEGDDDVVALNKVEGNRIREMVNLPLLGDEEVRGFEEVMAQVATNKADEQALDVAKTILRTRRQASDYEHAAMVLRAKKLLTALRNAQTRQGEAAERGDEAEYEKITAEIEGQRIGKTLLRTPGIIGELDMLTEADRHAGRESARALSIHRLWLASEKYDAANILQQIQVAKGPGGKTTAEERKKVAAGTAREQKAVKAVDDAKALEEAKELATVRASAQKVLNAEKPKKPISKSRGKTIKEKAARERAKLVKQLEAMGHRLNDITGLGPEATYILGRIGVTYIKSGVGNLVELAEAMKAKAPALNLTDYDVYMALSSRNPSAQAKDRSDAEKNVSRLQSMSRMLVELEDYANGIAPEPGEGKTAKQIDVEMVVLRKRLTTARQMFEKSPLNTAKLEKAVFIVNRLQDELQNGRTRLKNAPAEVPEQIVTLRMLAAELRTEIRVDEELAKVNRQLETGEFDTPKPKQIKKVNRDLEKKQIELARARRALRQLVADSKPKTFGRKVALVAAELKSIKATADISFVMRQNMWNMFAHPLRSTGIVEKVKFVGKALEGTLTKEDQFSKAMSAFFSDYSADQIYNAMLNSENAYLYESSGLTIMEPNSEDAQQKSEVFQGSFLEKTKIPVLRTLGAVVRASSRHAVTFGNIIRTSAFDAFVENHPNATGAELSAFADYVNVSTGLGDLGRFAAVGNTLQVVFFSPKFAVSRFQTPWALVKPGQPARVRKAVANDAARVVGTGSMIMLLAYMAGFDIELFDVDDPDWMKVRIGDTRLDFFGGFQQPARVIARIGKSATDRVGITEAVDGDTDQLEIAMRFTSYKLAPVITMPIELLRGKTAVGEEVTIPATVLRAAVPLVYEDVYEAYSEEGVGLAALAGAAAITGVGVSTYKDSKSTMQRKYKQLVAAGKHTEAARYKSEWKRHNPPKRKNLK